MICMISKKAVLRKIVKAYTAHYVQKGSFSNSMSYITVKEVRILLRLDLGIKILLVIAVSGRNLRKASAATLKMTLWDTSLMYFSNMKYFVRRMAIKHNAAKMLTVLKHRLRIFFISNLVPRIIFPPLPPGSDGRDEERTWGWACFIFQREIWRQLLNSLQVSSTFSTTFVES